MQIDPIDRKLLALLQEDAQLRYADLGEALHLSPPAVHDRVKKLRKAGVLRRYTVDVAPEPLGFPICALIPVVIKGATCEDVVPHLLPMPEIEECHSVAGQASLMLKVRTQSPKDLEAFLVRLWRVPGVEGSSSMLVLDTYIDRGARVG